MPVHPKTKVSAYVAKGQLLELQSENSLFRFIRILEIEKEAIMGNKPQDTSTSSGLLITLCTLTIIGSVFGILRAFLYEFGAMVAEVATGNMDMTYVRGLLYVAFHTGTLIGAIIMLCRSMVGFYMYTISQILYIVFVLYTTYATYDGLGGFEAIIGAMFWGPSLVFLILYWTLPTRKYLK